MKLGSKYPELLEQCIRKYRNREYRTETAKDNGNLGQSCTICKQRIQKGTLSLIIQRTEIIGKAKMTLDSTFHPKCIHNLAQLGHA